MSVNYMWQEPHKEEKPNNDNSFLDSVICRFLFIYVDGDYKLITYIEANNQDEAERKADGGWIRVVQLEEDMQIVYNGI